MLDGSTQTTIQRPQALHRKQHVDGWEAEGPPLCTACLPASHGCARFAPLTAYKLTATPPRFRQEDCTLCATNIPSSSRATHSITAFERLLHDCTLISMMPSDRIRPTPHPMPPTT
jgi:hypothetical protein